MKIEHLRTEEYFVTGTCVCEKDEEQFRRRNAGVLKRGISYVVAAISSVIAYQKAKEYFEEYCSNQFSEEDNCSFIRSEINEFDIEKHKEFENFVKTEREYWKRTHTCSGNCVESYVLSELAKEQQKEFDCEKMIFEETVQGTGTDPKEYVTSSAIYFQKHVLMPRCREKSKIPVKKVLKSGAEHLSYNFMCGGGSKKDFEKLNIVCIPNEIPDEKVIHENAKNQLEQFLIMEERWERENVEEEIEEAFKDIKF